MSTPGEPNWGALTSEALGASDEALSDASAPNEAAQPDTVQTVTQPEEVVADPEPVAEIQPSTVQSETEAEPEPLELPDNARVKLKIDGVEQVVSYKEYKDILRQNATITQRMQNFAQTREEFNREAAEIAARLEAREQALAQPRSDPAVQALVDALQGKTPPKPRDPNEILTVGELQQQQAQLREEFQKLTQEQQKTFQAELQAAAQNVQQQAAQQKQRQEFFSKVDALSLKDEYKVLHEVIPHVRAHILAHLNSVAPQSMDEALELSEGWLKDRLQKFQLHSVAKEQAQQKAAAKAKMESPDGNAPKITPTLRAEKVKSFVGKNGKPNWDAMFADAKKHGME